MYIYVTLHPSRSFLPSFCPSVPFFLRPHTQVISDHSKVAECSCIGIDDTLTGQAIASFVVLKNGVPNTPEVKQDIINLIRSRIGVVFVCLCASGPVWVI